MAKKNQLSLFGDNTVSMEDYKRSLLKGKRRKEEKKLMDDIVSAAASLDLPSVHIEYYCGNKFYPTCSGKRKQPHAPARAICPVCKKPVLAVCTNRINRGLVGQFDILGVSWAIETKHKRNKGRQVATLSATKKLIVPWYESLKVPDTIVKVIHTNKKW